MRSCSNPRRVQMSSKRVRRSLLSIALAAIMVVGALALGASGAAGADPPIVTVGPVTTPDGSTTGSGTVAPTGQADACLNDQHSGADPSATNPNGAAQVNESSCESGDGTQTAPGGGGSGSVNAQTGGTSGSGAATQPGGTSGGTSAGGSS